MNEKVHIVPVEQTEKIEPDQIVEGQWFWLTFTDDDKAEHRDLACVIHIGSNYAKLEIPRGGQYRVHFDEFDKRCEYCPNPDEIIKENISKQQTIVRGLMQEVKAVTARLAIASNAELSMPSMGSQEMVLYHLYNQGDMKSYETALELAKSKTLPDLFSKIKEENEEMAKWMTAQAVPFKVKTNELRRITDVIDDRIFSVELYAGLVEDVVTVKDGEPANIAEKITLMQRMHFMDEECLAKYETGGMDYKGIEDFDAWLARPENLDRILPAHRCIVSFRVRRHKKNRTAYGLGDFWRIIEEEKLDKLTYLYIKNGEQLFRIHTKIDFGPKLFPDMGNIHKPGKLWARIDHDGEVFNILTDNEYNEIKEKDWFDHYAPFDKSSVYYDDIKAHIASEIKAHNNIALVLQGLLDRSKVLHPHPPWQLWTGEGLDAALNLVLDSDRALVAGEAPNFKTYRDGLNESLEIGSVTLGQEEVWEEEMARKYNKERDRYRPYDEPSPGKFAVVSGLGRNGDVLFEWSKAKRDKTVVKRSLRVERDRLFNVSAYTPGDFEMFFSDPRTREGYLEWAPLLLEAEEYHAGNRTVDSFKVPTGKRPSSPEAKRDYERMKARRSWIGKAVKLKRDVEMKSGHVNKSGSFWRVMGLGGGAFELQHITKEGKRHEDGRWMSAIPSYYFDTVTGIPDPKKR